MRISYSFNPSDEDIGFISSNSDDSGFFHSLTYIKLIRRIGKKILTLCVYYDGIPSCLLVIECFYKRFNFYWKFVLGNFLEASPIIINNLDEDAKQLIQESIIEILKREIFSKLNIISYNFYINIKLDFLKNKLIENNYKNLEIKLAKIDLSLNEQALWRNLQQNFRNAIRQAERNRIDISKDSSPNKFPVFYRLLKENALKNNLSSPKYKIFKLETEELSGQNMIDLWFASRNEVSLSADYFIRYKDCVYWLYNGSLKEAYKFRANNLLLWKAIQYYAKEGLKIAHLGTLGYLQNDVSGYGRFKLGLRPQLFAGAYLVKINNPLLWRLGNINFKIKHYLKNIFL